MAHILSIESSAAACSVALHKEGELLHTLEINEPQAHAAKLALLIDEVLKATSVDVKSLHAVAVSSGPGSYTGLRIGTSVAKGLCMGLQIPLIAVSTLHSLANYVAKSASGKLLCPMIDARRMEVYTQIFDSTPRNLNDIEAMVIDKDSFSELLARQRVLFFGDGAEKCRRVLDHANAEFLNNIYPRAMFLGTVAWEKFLKKDFVDLTEFTPFYLKEFVAKKAQPVF